MAGASPTRPAAICSLADMDEAAQKGPGREHHRGSSDRATIAQPQAGDAGRPR